jgi:hypothetical protein
MFRFYSILKSRCPEDHITQEEINVASGKQPLTAKASSAFLGGLEVQSENIKNAFVKQQEQAAVCTMHCPWPFMTNVLLLSTGTMRSGSV